jgi:hypothetical protein
MLRPFNRNDLVAKISQKIATKTHSMVRFWLGVRLGLGVAATALRLEIPMK